MKGQDNPFLTQEILTKWQCLNFISSKLKICVLRLFIQQLYQPISFADLFYIWGTLEGIKYHISQLNLSI